MGFQRAAIMWLLAWTAGFVLIFAFVDLRAHGEWPAIAWSLGWLAVGVIAEEVWRAQDWREMKQRRRQDG